MFKAYRCRHVPAYILVAGLLLTAPACASTGYYTYQRDSSRDFAQRAFDNGYREGLIRGERDARAGRRFSYGRYRDDRRYRRGEGDRGYYRRAFRQGFERGYTDAFNRFGRDRRYYRW